MFGKLEKLTNNKKACIMNKLTIGKMCKYIRATPEGEVIFGAGMIKSIFIDARNRLMVGVIDGTNFKNWSVDAVTIDCDYKVAKKYRDAIAEVVRVTAEGNKRVQETVENYNNLVEQLYNESIGAPLDIIKAPEKGE